MVELTDNEIKIFGKPTFACMSYARLLIEGGVYKNGPQKAEYEQATF